MNTIIRLGLCLLITGCLVNFTGCKKKTNQTKPAIPAKVSEAKPAAAVNAEAGKTNVEQPKAAAIETIPVADVKAEASKMNVEQLKAKAMEYKELIVAKKATIEKLAAKLKEIPITQQMGAEAKALQADMANLNKAVSSLTERFQVYYGKLKEMGGDLSGLEI